MFLFVLCFLLNDQWIIECSELSVHRSIIYIYMYIYMLLLYVRTVFEQKFWFLCPNTLVLDEIFLHYIRLVGTWLNPRTYLPDSFQRINSRNTCICMYVCIKHRGWLSTYSKWFSTLLKNILGIESTNENCGAAAIVTQHMFSSIIKKIEDPAS